MMSEANKQLLEARFGQSNFDINVLPNGPDVNIEAVKNNDKLEENSSSNASCVHNNAILNVVAEINPVTTVSTVIANKSIYSTQDVITDSYSSPNRQSASNKRKRRNKVDSPYAKKTCNRPEKKIDELFKVNTIVQKMPVNSVQSDTVLCAQNPINSVKQLSISRTYSCSDSSRDSVQDAANIQNGACGADSDQNNGLLDLNATVVPVSQPEVRDIKRRNEELEHCIEECNKKMEEMKEKSKVARDMIKESLMSLTDCEREKCRHKMGRNDIKLGSFKSVRQGAHIEEKWIPGKKYQKLESRKKQLEQKWEQFNKQKKEFNRLTRKSNSSGGNKESQLQQSDIFERRKHALNRQEKEIQEDGDKLDRERVLHIRETKRINYEDVSRFKDYPVLNDRYLMLSLLGKGGFSEVFRAIDLNECCYVACKVHELNTQWPQEKKDSYIRHALREIEIHKKLDHPHIVKVFDVFNIDSDTFCTVQEFCPGNDLDLFLKRQQSPPRSLLLEKDARCIIRQVISALCYLNERRNPIIHYDLKPGNILLYEDYFIKITDFGLSKIFPDDNTQDGMELTSQGAGTYWYLPPECFVTENGPPTITSKVDVWSVGVIFFQCLYGKKPFGDKETQTDILHNNTILQARSINFPASPKVSDAAKDFIRKCCTYCKDLRPDVLQLRQDEYMKFDSEMPNLPGPPPISSSSSSTSSVIHPNRQADSSYTVVNPQQPHQPSPMPQVTS